MQIHTHIYVHMWLPLCQTNTLSWIPTLYGLGWISFLHTSFMHILFFYFFLQSTWYTVTLSWSQLFFFDSKWFSSWIWNILQSICVYYTLLLNKQNPYWENCRRDDDFLVGVFVSDFLRQLFVTHSKNSFH